MSAFTAANYLSNAGRTEGEMKTAFEDNLQATKQIPGAGAAETTLVISGGTITPTLGSHKVDTEGAGATDDLTNIAVTNLPDGSGLILRSVSSSRQVVLKQAAGGTGQMSLANAADVTLRTTLQWIQLKRGGGQWEEVARSGFVLPQEYARLEYLSPTAIMLGGGVVPLWIDGTWRVRQVLDAGVTVTNGGLAANTLYYVYAQASGASIILVLSTTGPIFSDGLYVQSGGQEKTLVGVVLTSAASQYQQSGTNYGVSSYFNRRLRMVVRYTATASTTSGSPIGIGGGINFLKWSDEFADVSVQAHMRSTTTAQVTLHVAHQGVAIAGLAADVAGASDRTPATVRTSIGGSTTGNNAVQAFGTTNAGTGTWGDIQEVATFMG